MEWTLRFVTFYIFFMPKHTHYTLTKIQKVKSIIGPLKVKVFFFYLWNVLLHFTPQHNILLFTVLHFIKHIVTHYSEMKKSMFQCVNELIALNDSFANLTNPLVAVLESTTDSMNQSVSPFKKKCYSVVLTYCKDILIYSFIICPD